MSAFRAPRLQRLDRICRLHRFGGRPSRALTCLLVAVLALSLAGCAYRGYIDQPITLKATWFSYIAGDDIRRACVPGGFDRYRLVYNGSYEEQLRAYDLVEVDGGGARLTTRVLGEMEAQAVIRDPSDLQAPWRWTRAETPLSPGAYLEIVAALWDSGFRRPANGARDFLSTEFYWIVSGCQDGTFLFNAWRFGEEAYAALAFPQLMLRHDETGIEVNPPRAASPLDRLGAHRPTGRRGSANTPHIFRIKVGPEGLLGRGPVL